MTRTAVCRRCGMPGPFREWGAATIYVEGWRPADIALLEDGSVACTAPRSWRVDDEMNDFDDAMKGGTFVCWNCDRMVHDLGELVVPELLPGDKILLPDGRRVLAQDVLDDARQRRRKVFAVGTVWEYDEVERWEPHPGQQTLALAA